MSNAADIKQVLVILSPDLISPDTPYESMLLRRAVELAKRSGCELELFHICFDDKLDRDFFSSARDLREQRKSLCDRDATKLEEIAARLKQDGIDVKYDVRWDYPRTDAMLRKIDESAADIVMKQSREHSYVAGITSNTDWDLVRRSPAHVWLVNEAREEIKRLVAAVGNRREDVVDVTTAADHEILSSTRDIAELFMAEIYAVNAFQPPVTDTYLVGATGVATPALPAGNRASERQQIYARHESAIHALGQHFLIDPANIKIREGHPSQVITELAQQVNADLIIVGANSINRMQRLVSAVTVEPLMARCKADIFVVRDGEETTIPRAAASPFSGVPKYNLEQAITNPEGNFDSPQDVVDMHDVSVELRKRILQAWEYDLRAQMAEENEGGPVRGIGVDMLDDIRAAAEVLVIAKSHSNGSGNKLSVASR